MAGSGRYQHLGDHFRVRHQFSSIKFWLILANIIVVALIVVNNHQSVGQQLSYLTTSSSLGENSQDRPEDISIHQAFDDGNTKPAEDEGNDDNVKGNKDEMGGNSEDGSKEEKGGNEEDKYEKEGKDGKDEKVEDGKDDSEDDNIDGDNVKDHQGGKDGQTNDTKIEEGDKKEAGEHKIPKAGVKIWNPPNITALVHGVSADPKKNKPSYTDVKFPSSPMFQELDQHGKEHPWLAAVICSATDIERRMLIRYTWMDMFKEVPMDKKFVISNPAAELVDVIQHENRTFGDIIVLENLKENDFTANTVKTIELYRWLATKSPRKYEFVTKMDTDLWVNAKGMWDRKILPRLAPAPAHGREEDKKALKATVENTVIASMYWDPYHLTSFPHGALYTVTWDLVEQLPKLQDMYQVIAGEDVTFAWLLMKARQTVNFVHLNHTEKFEFDSRDARPQEKTAWAQKATNKASVKHAVYGHDVLAVHQLKVVKDWFAVADCFDANGIKEAPDPETEKPHGKDDLEPRFMKPWHEEIPADYFERYDDGTWLVNGIWHLEKGMNERMEWTDGKAHLHPRRPRHSRDILRGH